jgi:hypothetical protein
MAQDERTGGCLSTIGFGLLLLMMMAGKAMVKDAGSAARLVTRAGDDVIPSIGREAGEVLDTTVTRAAGASSDAVQPAGGDGLEPLVRGTQDVLSEVHRVGRSSWKELPGERIATEALGHLDLQGYLGDLPASRARLLAIFPTNERSYERIFKKLPSAATSREIDEMINVLSRVPGDVVLEHSGLSGLLKNIEMSEGKLVVVLGHSEGGQGRFLVLSDGTTVDIADLHRRCLALEKVCLALTCNSSDFAIDGTISTADALSMWNRAVARSSAPGSTINDFVFAARKHRAILAARRAIVISTAVASGGAGGTYVVVTSYQDE